MDENGSPMTDNKQKSLAQRLVIGVSGQAFSRAISSLNTAALVPVLVAAWGVDGYGQWIALTAISSYLSYSNFGMVTTSAYEIIMAVGAGDIPRAARTFQLSINMAIYVVLPIIVGAVLCLSFLPLTKLFHLSQISSRDALLIVSLCGLQLWIQTLRGLWVTALYGKGSYGFAYYVAGTAKFVELVGIAIMVIGFGGHQLAAAGVMAGCAAIDFLVIFVSVKRSATWARVNLGLFDRHWLSTQAKPAVGLLISNLANQGLLVQGPRVILGALSGGYAVGVYAIYGTAIRVIDQLLLMVVLPTAIEIANCVGAREWTKAYRLIVMGNQLSWIFFLLIGMSLMGIGPWLFAVWTGHKIAFSYGLMATFLLMSACVQAGRVSSLALVSSNRMYGPSFYMLGFAIIGLLIGALLVGQYDVTGMVVGNIVGELGGAIVVVIAVTRWLAVPLSRYYVDMFHIAPSIEFIRRRLPGSLGK